MSASFNSVFTLEQCDTTDSSLRQVAQQHVQHYQSRQQRRQHIIASLRGKIANLRKIAEDSAMEPTTLEAVLTCLLKQHILIDELERNN
jgi:lambda repressor-like predicted transcriptional regulator